MRSSFVAAVTGLCSAGLCSAGLLAGSVPAQAQTCQFLAPVGGDGVTNIITKTIGPGNPFGRPNWNTDFFVTQPYGSYKFFFTANSSVSATYPIQGYLKFTDGSSLQVINELFAPQVGTGRMWGPFPAIPGKTVSQLNFKIGASPIRLPPGSPIASRPWVATDWVATDRAQPGHPGGSAPAVSRWRSETPLGPSWRDSPELVINGSSPGEG